MSKLNTTVPVVVAFCTGACFVQPLAAAQPDSAANYPNKPVRFIVLSVAGAGTDTTARTIAQKLSEPWGQQVIVDNRTGATGTIGLDLTAKAVPDGYTICLISASHAVNSATNPKLPYDLVKDLQAVTQATSLFYALSVTPSVPAKSVKELIAYAKANPGKLNFGSSGTGGLQHLAGEMFNHMAGVKLVHVPYKGAANVVVAMLSNDVQIGFTTLFGVRPHMPTGKLRVLAISAKLNAAIRETLKAPDVAQRLAAEGSTPVGTTPEQFSAHIKSEIAKWRRLAKEAKLELQE